MISLTPGPFPAEKTFQLLYQRQRENYAQNRTRYPARIKPSSTTIVPPAASSTAAPVFWQPIRSKISITGDLGWYLSAPPAEDFSVDLITDPKLKIAPSYLLSFQILHSNPVSAPLSLYIFL
ncbi:hypothetical protein B0O99DRAFT_600256 [Bisporella sp. PMI_857]|nr:hypothetical protein B0O99DRAFT_600256 [Bisporella sp. PMI_857]